MDGCAVVAEAALNAGVRRMVHCSSVHAFDLKRSMGTVVDESSPRVASNAPAYDRSKAAGENEIRRFVSRGLDAVCINPTGIIGPRDNTPSRMGTVLRAVWRRRLPAIVDGGFDWVDVRDVVLALRSAANRGRTGESYLIPGHRLSIRALAELAGRCSGSRVTTRVARTGWSTRPRRSRPRSPGRARRAPPCCRPVRRFTRCVAFQRSMVRRRSANWAINRVRSKTRSQICGRSSPQPESASGPPDRPRRTLRILRTPRCRHNIMAVRSRGGQGTVGCRRCV